VPYCVQKVTDSNEIGTDYNGFNMSAHCSSVTISSHSPIAGCTIFIWTTKHGNIVKPAPA